MNWLFFSFVAALTYGTYYVLLKRNINREHIWAYFAFFFTLLFVLLLPFSSLVVFPTSLNVWGIILVHVALLSMFFFFSSLAYKHLEESEVSPLGNLGLVLLVFAGIFLFNERLSLAQGVGVLLMIMGAFILEVGVHLSKFKKIFFSNPAHRKYFYCILLAIFFSVSSSIMEKILVDPLSVGFPVAPVTPFSLNFITRGLLMVFFLSHAFLKQGVVSKLEHVVRHAGWTILVAAVMYNVANISYFTALSLGDFSKVIPVASLSTLFIVIVGGSLFHEHHLARKIVGSIIMVCATVLIVG